MMRLTLGMLALVLLTPFAAAQTSAITPQATTPQPPTAHPWYVKPEHGAWMICVKSYTDTPDEKNAKLFAEALAQDIRERYKVPAYLFERGGVERQKMLETHAQELARRRAQRAEEEAQFNAVTAQAKAEAAAKGMVFMESKPSIRAPRVDIQEQYAVLVGGWPDMATARREMEKIKHWQAPADKKLMDAQFIVRDSEGGDRQGEIAYVNPFLNGMVVPNPVAPRQIDAEGEEDTKFVIKMNADEEYSVLKIKKNWTIAVKQIAPPHHMKGREKDSFLTRLFNPKPDAMTAAGEQARSMAKSLRSLKPTQQCPVGPFEAYVLHTRYGSLVCVGQFDGPEDPNLLKTQHELGMLKFNVNVQNGAKLNLVNEQNVRLFDHLYAMKVRD